MLFDCSVEPRELDLLSQQDFGLDYTLAPFMGVGYGSHPEGSE